MCSYFWTGCNGGSGYLVFRVTHNCWMKCGVVQLQLQCSVEYLQLALLSHGWQSEAINEPKGGAGSKSLLFRFLSLSSQQTSGLPIHLLIHLPIFLLTHHSDYPSIFPSAYVCPCDNLSMYPSFILLSANLFSYPSTYHHYPPIHISIHPSIDLSIPICLVC